MSTASTLRELKSTSQDFEWYPTTDEIIKTVCRDMDDEESQWHRFTSMLDVGAGDGRVLTAINASRNEHDQLDLFGIEKAVPHLSAMPKDITVVGTDLMEQSLLDKDVSVTFCNPPYSEYNPWMRKIIRETQSSLVYFVVPRRWKDQQAIECLIQDRDGDVETLGEFDFSDADREARCHVELIRISFGHRGQSPFDSVVEEMLPELDQFTADEELEENVEAQNEVAEGSDNIVERLVKAYDAELGQMISDYRSACSIKQSVLKQLGIEKSTIVDGIRNAVKTMKNRYSARDSAACSVPAVDQGKGVRRLHREQLLRIFDLGVEVVERLLRRAVDQPVPHVEQRQQRGEIQEQRPSLDEG
jgi:hypothetical protein